IANEEISALSQNDVRDHTLILYNRRFLVLFVLSATLFFNGEQWTCLSSITPQLEVFFNKSAQEINWFSNVFLIVLSIIALPSVYFPNLFGLKNCIIIGATLHVIGCLAKLVSSIVILNTSLLYYAWLLSVVFPAISQGFVLNLPPYLSEKWFDKKKRNLSTSIAYAANFLGVSTGFIFPNIILSHSSISVSFFTKLKIIFYSELENPLNLTGYLGAIAIIFGATFMFLSGFIISMYGKIELLVQATHPMQPYISCTAGLILANIFSSIYIYTLGFLEIPTKYTISLIVAAGSYAICLGSLIIAKFYL
ncbi:hypothetical protein MXB_3380, partial [Myxobolus squamalis]